MKERHARAERRAPRPGGRERHQAKGDQPGATVEGRYAGLRLDLFLAAVFPDLSRKQAKRLIDGRRVSVDGRIEAMASRVLRRGERVSVVLEASPEAPTTPPDLPVLYEDEECLAVLKPPGLPSGPTRDPGRRHAAALAERVAGRKLTLLHRLDKDTSGVLLLGKTSAFSAALLDAFRHRRVEKRYLALVRGRPQDRFEVVSHLREGEGDRMLTVRAGGMRAETAFRVRARAGEYALVEAAPRTGRTHQIRVHLAQAGCPILGDPLYGGDAAARGAPVPRQMLHARTLAFVHPRTGVELRLEAPVPADFQEVARAVFGPRLPAPLEGRSSTG